MSPQNSRLLALLLAASVGAACSIKKLAINGLADTLAASGDSFASDEDPDLIRDAIPFSLKTIESLLVEVPEHKGLLQDRRHLGGGRLRRI
jgi:hypothetical protein